MSAAARRPGPIIPSNAGTLRSLTVTMTVMCYLACLAIGALILINRAVSSWTAGLSREMTVQVRQIHSVNIEVELGKAATFVQAPHSSEVGSIVINRASTRCPTSS